MFKYSFDRKLEIQRAYLLRASRVHEKQVETLSKLHGYFTEIRSYLQLTQKRYVVEGEATEAYPERLVQTINLARDTLTFGRLLIPASVATQCGVFFDKVFESQREFAFSQWHMLQEVETGLKLRDKATDLSYQVIPELLTRIENAAREIIHVAR
jgi:hypothetical protein